MVVFNNIYALALATLVCAILWMIISDMDFREIRIELKQYVYMIIVSCVYLWCLRQFDALEGLTIYVIVMFMINLFFEKKEMRILFEMLVRRFKANENK